MKKRGGKGAAVEFWRGFHSLYAPHKGRPHVQRARGVPPRPSMLSELGELERVTYRADKGDGLISYTHTFGEDGGRRPLLAADVERERLHVLGGDYKVEARGIVD